MAEMFGLNRLVEQLLGRAVKEPQVSVSVGFTASYAIHVHEDLQMFHRVGQAKFLEQPARELSGDGTLKRIVLDAVKSGRTTAQGLLLAGLRIQRESQKLCPVLTGNLRASAFTRQDNA